MRVFTKIKDVAKYLDCSERTAYRLLYDGKIPPEKGETTVKGITIKSENIWTEKTLQGTKETLKKNRYRKKKGK